MSENMLKPREVVSPGEELEIGDMKPGMGVYIDNGKAYSKYLGVMQSRAGYLNVIPLSGKYIPKKGDKVIGKVVDVGPTVWTVDINAPYAAPLHVNDVPWRVEFGDTPRYMNIGDTVLVMVSSISEVKQVWITMKEQGLRKLEGGHLITIQPTKVPRVIGKEGSMIRMLKEHTGCRIYVGQNGVIWIDGEPERIIKLIKAIRLIEEGSHLMGLTDRVKSVLTSE